MSAEEDTELRDMVAQTLESKGVLGKIRVRKYALLFQLKKEGRIERQSSEILSCERSEFWPVPQPLVVSKRRDQFCYKL